MRYSLTVALLLHNLIIFAQKPVLDTSMFRKWASVGNESISDDGNYVSYYVYGQPPGTRKLIIQSRNADWKKEVTGAYEARFTHDNRQIVLKEGKDSLCLLILGSEQIFHIPHISEFHLSKEGQGEWLAYRLTTDDKKLVIRSLFTGKEQQFPFVADYMFMDSNSLLLKKETHEGNSVGIGLQWVDLSTGTVTEIWPRLDNKGNVGAYSVSPDDQQIAFLVEKRAGNHSTFELWMYKRAMDFAVKLVDDQSPGIDAGLKIAAQGLSFSRDSHDIFFSLVPTETVKAQEDAVQVDIWSYMDRSLQSSQLAERNRDIYYKVIYSSVRKKIIRLEKEDEKVIEMHENVALIEHPYGDLTTIFESGWNKTARSSYYLESAQDGSQRLIKGPDPNPLGRVALSPLGKWILYYDFNRRNYFSYEVATGIRRNITKDCAAVWTDEENDNLEIKLPWVPWRQTWLSDDKTVLIFDSYDIWIVDPAGNHAPINLTNGYGRTHHIKFGLVDEGPELQKLHFGTKSIVWLTAIDMKTKSRGYYSTVLGGKGNPTLLTMGPFVFGDWNGYHTNNSLPLKAKNANVYLIKRMSAEEAPNYFLTDDFIHYSRLSDVQPQRNCNWLTTELMHWKTFDGTFSTGILYKPENFDPAKKYPIIFDYYERRSDELNLYIIPQPSQDRINIAWYVSNGYLVFTPDIHYKIGRPGESAYNAIVSAAVYLSKKPWVNSKRMGIQGHSFGGYETDYIVTHSSLFAAACSVSGFCDLISWYGSAARGGYPIFWAEKDQGRMGGTPWQFQHAYINNSPIFKANKVATPLLMVNNKEDRTVPFLQGLEFFTALRRLGKRVWMLQYDGEGHSIDSDKATRDFSIRMSQFFDHYLKGMPAPEWMTKGIPAKLKGIDDGLNMYKK